MALGLDPARVASPATRARAGLVTRVMREQLPSDPAALAASPDDGARGARALDAAPGLFAPRWLEPALRTAALAGVVGAACGWDDETLVGLCCGALLADVGMLLLPPGVAGAGGAYSVVQRRMMQTHARRGAELLAPLAAVVPLVPLLALQHHERFDGNGYPSGLAGGAVRPEAQVVAVCHRFLAAIRERAYPPRAAAPRCLRPRPGARRHARRPLPDRRLRPRRRRLPAGLGRAPLGRARGRGGGPGGLGAPGGRGPLGRGRPARRAAPGGARRRPHGPRRPRHRAAAPARA